VWGDQIWWARGARTLDPLVLWLGNAGSGATRRTVVHGKATATVQNGLACGLSFFLFLKNEFWRWAKQLPLLISINRGLPLEVVIMPISNNEFCTPPKGFVQ